MTTARNVIPIGHHGNAWNAVLTTIGGTSNSVKVWNCPFVSCFGNSDGAATITVQYSQDGENFYDGATQVLSGSGNFRIDVTTGALFVRLKSSAAVTITATIAAK